MIRSKDSKQYKHLKKLTYKKHRDILNEFLVYGDHLITEAKRYSNIIEIYTSNPNKEGVLISDELMKSLSQTVTYFDQLAVLKKFNTVIDSNKVLILEDIQDPLNVGALLRSALAFGFKKVYLSNKCADIYNEKTIRASQGALFGLDIQRVDLIRVIKELKEIGFKIIGTTLNGEEKMPDTDKLAIVLGNEGSGISDDILELSDYLLTIKTETVESLNVLVAGSILMYEGSKF